MEPGNSGNNSLREFCLPVLWVSNSICFGARVGRKVLFLNRPDCEEVVAALSIHLVCHFITQPGLIPRDLERINISQNNKAQQLGVHTC